jgi:hypothetical protein
MRLSVAADFYMETNSPEDELTPAPPAEAPVGNVVPEPLANTPLEEGAEVAPAEPIEGATSEGAAPDELSQLAEASQKARLSPADEERMGTLLKEALLGGRAGVARAVEVLPRVPWIVGVRAVETVWPELTAGFRTQLLSSLAKEETDAARRIRLSLARALFKLDTPVALKLAVTVARELRDKETGTLTPKQAQIFANVFIGRGKPWLAQLPLTDLKPADIDALVHCAVLAVFTLPHPPVTQLGVLKWTAEQERLSKLDAPALEVLKKGISRWSAKWQGALRKEVAELPEEIVAMLKPAPEAAPEQEAAGEAAEGAESDSPSDEITNPDAVEETDEDDEDEDEDERDADAPKERPVYEPRPEKSSGDAQRERPVYTPRNAGTNVPRNFNLNEALRNIEAYANSLRAELATAKTRQKEERRRPEKSSGPIITGEPTLEELARLNQQLEARNTELQERITELTQHSEDLATSMGAMSSEPVSDTGAQLRTLLALKLQEDFADFLALKKETNDIVIQQHYRGLLDHVFEVLQQLEVPLKTE